VILLVSGATVTVAQYPELGVLLLPRSRPNPKSIIGRPYAIDNGAFSGFDAPAFLTLLDRIPQLPQCLFVAAPDVVGDAAATLALFRQWEPMLHARGWPVAFVGQDGITVDRVPWSMCDAIFLGGTTAWKLGRVARDLAAYGNARGKWVHMGRVNTRNRIRYAKRIGAQSVDGSQWSRWPATHLPTYGPTLEAFEGGPLLRL